MIFNLFDESYNIWEFSCPHIVNNNFFIKPLETIFVKLKIQLCEKGHRPNFFVP
jgi:hypothetical protein